MKRLIAVIIIILALAGYNVTLKAPWDDIVGFFSYSKKLCKSH